MFFVKTGKVIVENGIFDGNKAGEGAVGFTGDEAALYIDGGNFSRNIAGDNGGVFFIDEGTTFAVSFGVDEEVYVQGERFVPELLGFCIINTRRSTTKVQQRTLKEVCWLAPFVNPFVMSMINLFREYFSLGGCQFPFK